jgi:hypothetical protein
MPDTPIAQQAEAAITRINQLTERMLTAARNAGGGLAGAHEKALRSLADNPADLKQPVEWVQALAGSRQLDWPQAVARSHTKFVTDLVSMYANAIRSGLSG